MRPARRSGSSRARAPSAPLTASVHQFLALKIYAGGTDTERTVRITYRAANAVRFFKDHDEFYWNVTGNDWKVPIDSASAFVALPSAATGQLKAQAFTGAFGSREQGCHHRHRRQQHHLRELRSASTTQRTHHRRLHTEGHSERALLVYPLRCLVHWRQSRRTAASVGLRRNVRPLVVEGTRPRSRHFGCADV